MKILAAIDIMGGQVVRLTQGQTNKKIVYSNDPKKIAKKWEEDGADMLHIVDLDAALGNNNNYDLINDIISSVKVPVQVGGGVRSPEIFAKFIEMGCDRVVVGTMAYKFPNKVRKLCKTYPGKIVLSLDQLNGIVMINGWKLSSGYQVRGGLEKFKKYGIDNFLLTSISHDGTLQGPDIETLNDANSDRSSKIIASGGISNLLDVLRVFSVGCSGAILGKSLYEGKIDIKKIKAII